MYTVHIYYRAPEKVGDEWHPERWGCHQISKKRDYRRDALNCAQDAVTRGLWVDGTAGKAWVKATWAYIEWVEEEEEIAS